MNRHVLIGAIKSGWLALAARVCVCLLVWAINLPEPVSGAQLGVTKRVLILHSFGRDFRPWGQYAKIIRERLVQLSPWQLDIQDHALVSALSSDENPEPPFVAYLNALNAKHPPDIVISIGAPAADFLQRNRERLFSQIPMVLTSVEQRRIQFSKTAQQTNL